MPSRPGRRDTLWVMRCHTLLAAAALAAAPPFAVRHASAQPADASQPARVNLDELEPGPRLGARVELIRQQVRVIPDVVLVPNESVYYQALSTWTPERLFPVLIDDGTPAARRDIARFVRAFEPRSVLRYEPPVDLPPITTENAEEVLNEVLVASWSTAPGATREQLLEAWAQQPLAAPGVVVTHRRDPARAAALPLAIARAQPILFIRAPLGVDGSLAPDQLDAIARDLEAQLESTGLAWSGLGDQVDAVTLCLALPARTRATVAGQSEFLATTDLIGRHVGDTDGSRRWAWSSQIFGDAPRAASTAMSSLFLAPRDALLFDSYPAEPPWSGYALDPAAALLEAAGMTVLLRRGSNSTRRDWQLLATRPASASLMFVNSKGNRDFFELRDGRTGPGDVPILDAPAIVHFIHSWSAVTPGARETVAGRWLERGAYAYMGSVHEPFLNAFIPPELVTRRLLSLYPWAHAPRYDRSQPWKIALFGDALLTLGAPLERSQGKPALEFLSSVSERASRAVAEADYETAIALFSLLARDADAARLTLALMKEKPEVFTPAVANAGFFAVFREGSPRDLILLLRAMTEEDARDPAVVDALWLRLRPLLTDADPDTAGAAIAVLSSRLRASQPDFDAIEIARAMRAHPGGYNPVAFLQRIRSDNPRRQQAIDREIQRLRGR